MALKRIFLGWNRPGLARVAEYLIEQWAKPGALDLSGVTVVVPGGRAGRRLLEILVDYADQRGTALSPPEIVTLGRLPELLYVPKRPFADELTQQLAWIAALRRCEPKEVEPFLPAMPATGDLPAWLALAEMLARVHRELAADGLGFLDVEAQGRRVSGFCESPRWRALAAVQRRYLETLDSLGLWDVQTARLVAVRQRECQTRSDVVLAGTVDLNRVQRQLLDQIAARTTALVLAPADLSDRFDGYGCLRPAAWQEAPIGIDDEQIEWVAGPAEQAAAAVRTIAGYGGRYAGDEITVGVPDPEVVPFLEQYLRQCGVATHSAAGRPIGRTAPCALLAAAAEHLASRRFATLAALVRHPDLQDRLAAQGVEGDYLSELDAYAGQHMPYTVDGPWLGPPEERRTIEQVHRAVEDLLAGLRGSPRPLPAWGQPILDLLTAVFGARPLCATAEPDRTVLSACERIRSAVLDLRELPAELAPSVSGAEAVRLVLGQVEGESIPGIAERGAIELLGWLELPLDDAPALVVTGFNEGIVPSAVRADLFLPNQLRTELDLDDSDRRYARDAYALSVLAASRERLKLIGGRRSAAGDPLAPSRLLLACDAERAARRTVRLFSAAEAPAPAAPLPGAPLPGRARSAFDVPRPQKLAEPVTSMRVTEFRDYLACPYRYYLRHRLGLGALDDSAEELDGGSFGALAHEVLRAFGESKVALSTDPDEIFAY
ncbi:MAG: PD-(D/E)XK nuclease family protein, partial [Thermoguttaceae bacterium]|nr:PD-(D/E)XK nuclease family protein [Thermoguttaceae bacterium]